MSYRTYYVSHHKDDGFTLHIIKKSLRGEILESIAHVLCTATRQRFCWELCCKAANWSDKREVRLLEIPIDREQADAIAWGEDDWTWLDEDGVD